MLRKISIHRIVNNRFLSVAPVTGVRKNHEFNVSSLNEYLKLIGLQNLQTGTIEIKQFSHGQSNPTFLVVTSSGKKYTVRKQPPGQLLAGAHAVDREFTVMTALKKTNVKVPTTRVYCDDSSIIGSPFFIYDYVEGSFYKDASLNAIHHPAIRTSMYHNLIDSLAKIHSVDVDAIGLGSYGKRVTPSSNVAESGFIARQIKTWSRQYKATETEIIPEMNFLIENLSKLIPHDAEKKSCLIHGDYRMDNVLFHPNDSTKPTEIAAVLDWELSTLGDGLSDLAYFCLSYTLSPNNGFMRGLNGLDLTTLGIPTLEETVRLYAERLAFHSGSSDVSPDALLNQMDYYMAFSLFRCCAILQGVYKRSLAGNASAENAGQALVFAKESAFMGAEYLVRYQARLMENQRQNTIMRKVLREKKSEEGVDLFAGSAYQSARASETLNLLKSFMRERVLPCADEIQSLGYVDSNYKWTIHPKMEELKREAKHLGLWNLFLPVETDKGKFGGGFTNLEYARMAEVTGYCITAPEVFNCAAPDTGNMEVLARYGTEEQQKEWLFPLLEGNIRSCFAMTEPQVASSDATNMQATIRRVGDNLILNGRKWWISGALDPRCKVVIFMGRTFGDLDAQGLSPHMRHSMVLVPMDTPGVKILRPMKVMGYDDAPHGHADMIFDNVVVPASNFILGEGRGFEIAQGRLGPGRIHHCMRLIGAAEAALELMCQRVTERIAFGKPLAEQGTILADIALSRVEIDQARLLCLNAAHKMDVVGNKAAKDDIAAIKIVSPRMAKKVVDRAIQAFGAMGLSQDSPLAHMWVWARILQLADGPDEVHMAAIAKSEINKQVPHYYSSRKAQKNRK